MWRVNNSQHSEPSQSRSTSRGRGRPGRGSRGRRGRGRPGRGSSGGRGRGGLGQETRGSGGGGRGPANTMNPGVPDPQLQHARLRIRARGNMNAAMYRYVARQYEGGSPEVQYGELNPEDPEFAEELFGRRNIFWDEGTVGDEPESYIFPSKSSRGRPRGRYAGRASVRYFKEPPDNESKPSKDTSPAMKKTTKTANFASLKTVPLKSILKKSAKTSPQYAVNFKAEVDFEKTRVEPAVQQSTRGRKRKAIDEAEDSKPLAPQKRPVAVPRSSLVVPRNLQIDMVDEGPATGKVVGGRTLRNRNKD